ncbi:MAB_1171c family putative transporter [Streptomyces sp. NPDC044780]|uniref:MAB_1171c family putative transporter n=1 Tax=unclassified Streptomyces TaxID=2593676 RepID=UPI003401DD61
MNNYLYPTAAAISLLAFIYKLRVLRTDPSPMQVALLGNFFFLTITFTISTPPVWVEISQAAGIINLSGLLSQGTVILSAACQQLVLLHLSHERSIAWRKSVPRLAFLALVLTTMVTLFCVASSFGERPDDFAVTNARYYPAYMIVYLTGHTVNQIDVGILGWRYARVAPTRWLRRGFMLIALSVPVQLGYIGSRFADVIAGLLETTGHAWEPAAQIAVTVSTVTKTIGWTIPDWGRHLSRAWAWIDCRRAYHQLAPLHTKVTSYAPDVVLDPGDVDVRTRLYRLVVEIRDAQWRLRTWMAPAVAEEARKQAAAAGLREEELAATVEAAQLAAAMQAKDHGIRPVEYPNSPLEAEPQDLAAEITFQRKVARAFDASPTVAAVLNRTAHSRPTPQEPT